MVWKNGEEKKVSFGSLLFAIPISSKRLSRCLDFDAASLSLSLTRAAGLEGGEGEVAAEQARGGGGGG